MTTPGAPSCSSDFAARATAYATDVVTGRISSCKQLKQACSRHLADLKRKGFRWRYSASHANRVCRFVELLPHVKGELQGERVQLQEWQIFLIASIFGWVAEDDYRRYREAFVLIPKGNGKSPIAAWIGLWMAFFAGEKGAEVYCGAANQDQAHEVFRVAKAIVEMTPALVKHGIQPNASSIVHPVQRSRFKPVIGKPKDGASVYLAILDELHQQPSAEQYDTFVTGSNKRKGSLVLVISTAGSTTEGPCHARQQDVEKVLDGTVEDDRLFGLIYTADESVDWTSPAALEMANPNLHVSMDTERMYQQQAEAARNPAKQNSFRNKHLNQWTNAATGWLNMAAWNACGEDLVESDFTFDSCWIGCDMASKKDLAAVVKLFRRDIDGKPHYYAFARTYLPQSCIDDPAHQHYQRWHRAGYIDATRGASIDYAQIEADTIADITAYRIDELAYDERYADQFSQRVSEACGIERVVVPPNASAFSPAMKEVEAAVMDGRFHFAPNPVLTWCMGNVISEEWGGTGNLRMPDKSRPENKIDAAVALFIAMSRAYRIPAQPVSNWSPTVWA